MSKIPAGAAVGEIEDGVPMPRSKNYGGLRSPMEKLQPTQSFTTTLSRSAVYAMAKKMGYRVNVRQESEERIRVWRLA